MSRFRNGLLVLAIAAALTACGQSASTRRHHSARDQRPGAVLETSKMSGDEVPTVTVSAKRDADSKPQI